jgi:hypothetical protein
MQPIFWRGLLAAGVLCSGVSQAAVLVGSYGFNDTLAADQSGVASLVAIDPAAANHFETATVNGSSQRVYHWGGSGADPSTQGGFSLDTTGLVSYDNYSVEMLFRFDTLPAFGTGWRRIVDTQNRQSDNGFYVAPDFENNVLQVFPVVNGHTTFTTGEFHNVVLTNFVVNGVREVKAYLDGVLELESDTDQLNLDNANNPGHLLNFFVDNLSGPAQLEWAAGSIAALRLYDGIIVPTRVPEPASAALVLLALGGLAAASRRRASAQL